MDRSSEQALVYQVLVHAEAYPWVMQDIGLMGLRLDDERQWRLHIWDPDLSVGEPPIHDHPFDFESLVVAGEMFNTRYVEDASGDEYRRFRYPADREGDRRDTGTVRLTGTTSTHVAGERYTQRAEELHDSRQLPGTVTLIRWMFVEVAELTVCLRDDAPWVSAKSRPATTDEIKQFAAKALAWF